MSDVLTYVDFNTSSLPRFGLKTVLFHSMELLSSNHLELVTKLCPEVEWLSLNSALFYNLEGLGRLPRLSLLRLHYKSRPLDQTVADFFSLNAHGLTTLHLFEVKDLHRPFIDELTPGDLEARTNLKWDKATVTRAVYKELVTVSRTNENEPAVETFGQTLIWLACLITTSGDHVLEVLNVPDIKVVVNLR